jgi:RPA family protein
MADQWRDVLAGLEPETITVFKDDRRSMWSASDVAQAVAHSQAVSAAKANKYTELVYNQNQTLIDVLQALREDINGIQTYGLRLAK